MDQHEIYRWIGGNKRQEVWLEAERPRLGMNKILLSLPPLHRFSLPSVPILRLQLSARAAASAPPGSGSPRACTQDSWREFPTFDKRLAVYTNLNIVSAATAWINKHHKLGNDAESPR